jgi:DNA-binding response OmpR family regulator
MEASIENGAPLAILSPGRFTRVSIRTLAGEVEARLSEGGQWELRMRREDEDTWRLACRGDLDSGAVSAEPVQRDVFECGPLVVELESRRAMVNGSALKLSRKEFALLVVLAARPDRVLTKEELLSMIWGYTGTDKSRTLDSHASKLRRKLRRAGAHDMIVNSWGHGYRLWDRPESSMPSPLSAARTG